ncbi:MAG: ABC transporter ATP-binding protein [Sarcina sp.]
MIKLIDINKIYNKDKSSKFIALQNLNIDIKKGELVAIMGTSGSGKTTLLNILSLIDDASSGKYIFKDKDITKMSYKDVCRFRNEEVGIVFQNFNLLNNYSIIDNINIPIIYSTSKENMYKRVSKMIKQIGLEEHKNKLIEELSGGQKQRVAIGRALINNPELILADEPTGALDKKTKEEILELFLQINGEGKTVIIITHDINVAKKCSRIITLEDGVLISDTQSLEKMN